MGHYGASVEYGLHCLLLLAGAGDGAPPSSRDLAEFQGISPSYVAKLFTQLEKAGIVGSSEGLDGGFRLAKPADDISVRDVVVALEGDKPLFRCKEIRRNCVLYDGAPPAWASRGVCGIHAVMIDAEKRMLEALGETTLADLGREVGGKTPQGFVARKAGWFGARGDARRGTGRGVRTIIDGKGRVS